MSYWLIRSVKPLRGSDKARYSNVTGVSLGDDAATSEVGFPPKPVTRSVISPSPLSLEPALPKEANLGFYPRAILNLYEPH